MAGRQRAIGNRHFDQLSSFAVGSVCFDPTQLQLAERWMAAVGNQGETPGQEHATLSSSLPSRVADPFAPSVIFGYPMPDEYLP